MFTAQCSGPGFSPRDHKKETGRTQRRRENIAAEQAQYLQTHICKALTANTAGGEVNS